MLLRIMSVFSAQKAQGRGRSGWENIFEAPLDFDSLDTNYADQLLGVRPPLPP